MKNFYILTDAINYIEENLCHEFTLEDVAEACYFSLSGLKKLFAYAFHLGLKEYVSKRRMSHAARDLLHTELTVTDIALKYQYNSPEVFTRAFSKAWGITPSAFRKQWSFSGFFPKIEFEYDGGKLMSRKKVDLSELYDLLKNRADRYVLCFDIMSFQTINDTYGREAGDKVIIECLRRIDSLSEDDSVLFRIGGDEFALVTDVKDRLQAEQLAAKITALNGQTILVHEHNIPVSMRVGATKIDAKTVRYKELFENLDRTIEEAKQNTGNLAYYILR